MIYLIYRLEGDRGGKDAAAFDSSATWRGYTAARRRRPNAASDERAAMRTEDEDSHQAVCRDGLADRLLRSSRF